jgi:hypothetical protein
VISIAPSIDQARIKVRGALTGDERVRWSAVERWFDGAHGGAFMLDAQFGSRSDDVVLPFRIISLKSGPHPAIQIQDGRSFPVGSILPGGWRLDTVGGMLIVLTRGDRELTIAF